MRHPFKVKCECGKWHETALIDSKELEGHKYSANSAVRQNPESGFPPPIIPPNKPQKAWWLEDEVIEYKNSDWKREVEELPEDQLRERFRILEEKLKNL